MAEKEKETVEAETKAAEPAAEDETSEKRTKRPGGVHAGHRQRVKERFLNESLEKFDPHQVMEMLLFFGIPMKDTNELAHAVLDEFGSIYKAMEASFADLRKIPGITDNAATLICFSGQLAKRYWMDRCDIGKIMSDSSKIGELVKYRLAGERDECVLLVSMDNRRKLLNCTRIAKGSVNSADINIRLALRQALQDNATQVAIAHNHPNGHAYPSSADIRTTQLFAKALAVADIHLVDHIIVSEDDYISMAETDSLAPIFRANYSLSDPANDDQ